MTVTGKRQTPAANHSPPAESLQPEAAPEELRQFLAESRDFRERCVQLGNMRAELTQKYPDHWVALTGSGQLVVANSVAEMVQQVEELGERPGFAAVKFLNTRPRRVALR